MHTLETLMPLSCGQIQRQVDNRALHRGNGKPGDHFFVQQLHVRFCCNMIVYSMCYILPSKATLGAQVRAICGS